MSSGADDAIARLLQQALETLQEPEATELRGQIRAHQELQENLRLAGEFQDSILPTFPEVPYLRFARRFRPHGAVSGDMFEFFFNRERWSHVFVGDATGHGIAAAFITMMTHVGLRTVRGDYAPDAMLAHVNRLLASVDLNGMFITGVLVRVLPDGRLYCASAGHPPPVLVPVAGPLRQIGGQGMPMGWFDEPNVAFTNESVQLNDGDRVLLFTDGVTERWSPEGEQFGTERLLDTLAQHRGADGEGMMNGLDAALDAFAEGAPADDDSTALLMTYHTPEP